ncbi:MAG: hypothetical protein ACLTA7_07615, partial [Ruminococcus sp.]
VEIPITEISTDNFSLVYDKLNQITPGISPLRVRETRRVIKTIVDTSISSSESAESVIVGIDDINNLDLSSKPLAIAIGYRENILSKFGYGVFDDELILEDILYDNKHFDSERMCTERFKSIPVSRLFPVFKYLKLSGFSPIPGSKLEKYVEAHKTVEQIIAKNIQKTLKNVPSISDLNILLEEIDKQPDFNKRSGVLLKNIENFSLSDIRKLCCKLFESGSSSDRNTSTNFKRCVMYLDLKENYIEKKSY